MINLSQKNIKAVADRTRFIKDTVEKVLRLADILEFISDSSLADMLVLKGGTPINLLYFDLPRMSVDIDLDYTRGGKEQMLADRIRIRLRICNK
jgi:predicted nucleotidyltransferase component of viral defense system